MKTKLKWKHGHAGVSCTLKLGKTIKVLKRQLKDLRKERNGSLADAALAFSNISESDFDWYDDEEGDTGMNAEGMASDLNRATAINYIISDINDKLEEMENVAEDDE